MNISTRHRNTRIRLGKALAFAAAILGTTKLTLEFASLTTTSTTAFSFLIIVLLSAYFGDLAVAITTSFVAALCFDYFYLPPAGTLNITAFADWISLGAFLLASVIISRLTASAAEHRANSNLLAKTLMQLKEFGEWLLSTPNKQLSLSGIAKEALTIFSLEYCSIHVHGEGKWQHHSGASEASLSQEIESRLKSIQDHSTSLMDLADESLLDVRYVQINKGETPLVVLAVRSKTLPGDALGTVASMISVRLSTVGEFTPPSAK